MARILFVTAAALMLAGCAEQAVTAMESANEVAVIATLRSLHAIQTQFLMSKQRYGSLEELRSEGLVDQSIAGGQKHRYIFTVVSADERGYALRADPAPDNNLNQRHFYIDQTGVVRSSYNRPAGPQDMPSVM